MGQVQKTTLKNEMKRAFDILEKSYRKKISPHKKAIGELGQKIQSMDDYEIIL